MKSLLTFLTLIFLFTNNVYSQEVIDTTRKTALGVNPAIMEVVLDGGRTDKQEVVLYNLTNFPIPIKTTAESFTPKEKLEIPRDKRKRFDASSWIEIGPGERDFILQARETKKVTISITQPKDASPGGHYASIVFEPLIPQQLVSKESIFVFARVATLLFMQVRGDVREDLSIKSVPVEPVYESVPDRFSVILRNDGNTHIRPAGKLVIRDEIRGRQAGVLTFLPSIILPDTEKEYPMETGDNIKLPVGKYSLVAEVSYGADNNLLKSPRRTFYVFPFRTGLAALAALSVVVFVARRQKNRLSKALKIIILGERFDRIEKRREMEALDRIRITKLRPK